MMEDSGDGKVNKKRLTSSAGLQQDTGMKSDKESAKISRKNNGDETVEQSTKKEKNSSTDLSQAKSSTDDAEQVDLRGSFWLTRIVLIRYMGFIYCFAFLVSLLQNKELMGQDGLLPANLHLDNIVGHVGGSDRTFSLLSYAPTLLWFVDYHQNLNFWLDAIAWTGLSISVFMMVKGAGNWLLLLFQWMLYHSLVNVGQTWFSFGWESQLLETGFLTVFLCPLLSLSPVPKATPSPFILLMAYRWLIFRIMLGAGLIKIRGDKCWRDLTCMHYHYETQPVPNPISYFLHQSPEPVHQFEVLSNHFIELVAPFLLFLPRRFAVVGGIIQIFFQAVLIVSGNLSFLNWLTITPSLACFDDASLAWMFSKGPGTVRDRVGKIVGEASRKLQPLSLGQCIRRVFNVCLGILLVYLSVPVIQNLLSPRQAMNTSFDPLRLVNTYGAFGSVTKKRTEVIFQGTSSRDPNAPDALWEEYQFHCKPGDVSRRPCLISPYHYRLDWLMWFAAFQSYQHNPWLVHVAGKLLVNSNVTDSLISHNPFQGRGPPRFVRAEHYRYSYTKLFSTEAGKGAWWKRKRIGSYLPIVSLESLRPIFKQMGWPMPQHTR